MFARDLQPGMSFKKDGQSAYREVKEVKDLDLVVEPGKTKPARILQGKIQVTCTDGKSFWIYKTDRVHLEPPPVRDVRDIETDFEIVKA